MSDPYSVLGLSSTASDEEVKKAYKTLAKKYHPDVCGNDPEAAKKMQEINAAYDAIINHKDYRSAGDGANAYSNFYSYNRNYSSDGESTEMRACANYINAGRFKEALHVLSTVKMSDRNGRWYYYSSIAKYYCGDTTGATSDIAEALKLEPNNFQYKTFLDKIRYGRAQYTQRRQGFPASDSFLSCCVPIILINLFCPGYFCIC